MREIVSPLDGFSGLTSRRGVSLLALIRALFRSGEPGIWLDPNDISTLFQDVAGTQPVTAPGQTVALMLDKSKGLVLGSGRVTNGTFVTNDLTGWINTSIGTGTVNASTGVAVLTSTSGTDSARLEQTLTAIASRFYEIKFDVIGPATAYFQAVGFNQFRNLAPGSHRFVVRTTSESPILEFRVAGDNGSTGIDNVSVRELLGFHAPQATAASRPAYGIMPEGGRRNLLTRTEEFDNAAWSASTSVTLATTGGAFNNMSVVVTGTTPQIRSGSFASSLGTAASSMQVKVKGGTARYWAFTPYRFSPTVLGGSAAVFDTTTGAFSSVGDNVTAGPVVSLSDGFWLISLTFNADSNRDGFQIAPYNGPEQSDGYFATVSGSVVGFVAQASLSLGATGSYQRVGTALDVTEAGKRSVGYLFDDEVGDTLLATLPDLGTDATLFFATEDGVTISGGETIGAGSFDALRGKKTFAAGAINRALTATETANVTKYLNQAAGIVS